MLQKQIVDKAKYIHISEFRMFAEYALPVVRIIVPRLQG